MLKAPFPYFGGKSRAAPFVWQALGQPAHYIEPCFGSGAVLLNRPNYDPTAMTETVNDADGYLANLWRALQHAPDEVARWCDWPVNHCELNARRRRLLSNEARLLENLTADDEWYDAKLAGYWIWAASCWIGSGLTRANAIPHIGNGGMGVQEPYNISLYDWFRQLADRLRYVRVVCGDWMRVCGGNWQDYMGTVGIFFDPPYSVDDRDSDIYHHDSLTVARDIAKWCLERGKLPSYRIVLAGYYEEHAWLLEHGWQVKKWSTQGGYGHTARGKESSPGRINRHREALFFSPHCLKPDRPLQGELL